MRKENTLENNMIIYDNIQDMNKMPEDNKPIKKRHYNYSREYVYIILREEEVMFASCDESAVSAYFDELKDQDIADTAEEWDWDINEEGELQQAMIQNGIDNGLYEFIKVPVDQLKTETEIELENGSYILASDILDVLEE